MNQYKKRIRRTFAAALLAGLSGGFLLASTASGQSTAATTESPYIAVISTDGAYLRSGAAKTYYPMVQLKRGDLIEVVGEKNRWARVRVVGPAMSEAQGFVLYPKTESGHVRLAADGKTAVALGQLPVYARNLNTTDPSLCWKRICNVAPNQTIEIIETTTVDGGGGSPAQMAHRIRLPKQADGWISMAFVSRANDAEVAIWRASLTAPAKPNLLATETPRANTTEQRATATPVEEKPSADIAPVVESTPTATAPPVATLPTSSPRVEPLPTTIDTAVDEQTETPASKELASLEDRYKRLCAKPATTKELVPLQSLYAKFVSEYPDSPEAQYASLRVEQLGIWNDLQQRQRAIATLKDSANTAAEHNSSIRLALANGGDYVAVGRLGASAIFDGDQLPRLYRLQDPGTGRTLAYIVPNEDVSLTMMLGQLIGINGSKSYDSALRLELIEPNRIDILAPQQ